jgi:hypothetical protein
MGWGKISIDLDNSLVHSSSWNGDHRPALRKFHLVWKTKSDFRVRTSMPSGHNLNGSMKPPPPYFLDTFHCYSPIYSLLPTISFLHAFRLKYWYTFQLSEFLLIVPPMWFSLVA